MVFGHFTLRMHLARHSWEALLHMVFCGHAVWKGIFESFTLTEVSSSMPIQFLLRSVLACRVMYIAFENGLGEKCATSHQVFYVCECRTWRHASRTNWRYFASLVVDARTTELKLLRTGLAHRFCKASTAVNKAYNIFYLGSNDKSYGHLRAILRSAFALPPMRTQSIAMLLHSDIAH